LLVVSKAIRAEHDCPDEVGDLTKSARTAVDSVVKKAKVIQAKAPPELPPDAVSDATPVAGQAEIEPAQDSRTNSSRRRGTDEREIRKSSRRMPADPGDITELAIERLRQRSNLDVDEIRPVLVADRATLDEVMRRLANLDETCPLCGKQCADRDGGNDVAGTQVPNQLNVRGRRPLNDVAHDESSKVGALARPLQTGEPAQIILDTQRRLGKSVLDGTEFGGSPELLVQWIRALDEENRRQQALLEEVSRTDVDDADADRPEVSKQSQVDSLRNACRELQEAADLLEEHNLFEAADSVRAVVDGLRRQSRTIFSELEATNADPLVTPDGDQ
jgi:hypothetical protein